MQKTIYRPAVQSNTATLGAPATKTVQMAAVKVRHQRKLQKVGPLLLALCLVVAVFAVLLVPMLVDGAAPASEKPVIPVQQRSVVSYSSLQEAADALSFTPQRPTVIPEEFQVTAYHVVDGEMLEIEYMSTKATVVFRMGEGSDDLSEVDKEYAYTVTETSNKITRNYAGVSKQKLQMAVWADKSFSYALVTTEGIEAGQMRTLAESVA